MDEIEQLAERARWAFQTTRRSGSWSGRELNTGLTLEVVEPAMALDTPTLLVIEPWTVRGLAFPPDGRLPEAIVVDGRLCRVFSCEDPVLGPYRSVDLRSDITRLLRPDAGRELARALAGPFQEAVARARRSVLGDPSAGH